MPPRRIHFLIALALCLHAPLHAEEKPAPAAQGKKLTAEERKLYKAGKAAVDRAEDFLDRENYDGAEKELRAAIGILQRVLGPEHRITLKTRTTRGRLLQCQNMVAAAERELREVLAIQKRVLGANHDDIVLTRRGLAEVFQSQGKDAEAETQLREALTIVQRNPRRNQMAAILILEDLALSLEAQGMLKEALPFVQKAEAAYHRASRRTTEGFLTPTAIRERIEAAFKAQEAEKGGK